jgi:thymidylate synthase
LGNAHIYKEHLEPMKEQISREPYKFPTVTILNKKDNIDDYVLEDFCIEDYQHHQQIKMSMVA